MPLPSGIAVCLTLAVSPVALADNGVRGLGRLGANDTTAATCISADGNTVIGYSAPPGGPGFLNRTPLRWVIDQGGAPQSLGRPSGWSDAYAARTSAAGGTVLSLSIQGTTFLSARWTTNSPIQPLAWPSSWLTVRARDVSPDGSTIIGSASVPGVGARALRWVGTAQPDFLPLPADALGSQALCFDAAGNAIGTVSQPGRPDRLARWSAADGAVQVLGDLPTSPTITSGPLRASADGSVLLGETDYIAGPPRYETWVWTAATGRVVLPLLPGTVSAVPNAISGDGRLVAGWCTTQDLLTTVPFMWTPTLGTVPLDQFLTLSGVNFDGWNLGPVTGISQDGTRLACSGTFNGGAPQAVLIQIPSPAAPLLALPLIRRRRRP